MDQLGKGLEELGYFVVYVVLPLAMVGLIAIFAGLGWLVCFLIGHLRWIQ